MNTQVQFFVKNVYGKPLAYPVNDMAKGLASIRGTKTLTVWTLRCAHEMGFTLAEVDRHGRETGQYWHKSRGGGLPAVVD